IKIGDVDGSVVSTLSGQQLHSRFGQRKFVVANSVDYKAGEKVNISLNLDMLAASVGFQFTVKLKEGVDIISVSSESDKLSTDNFGLTKLENGLIAISWHSFDGNEFGVNNRIVIEAITDHEGVVSDALLINSDVVESEAYGADGKVHAIGVKFAYDENAELTYALGQNYPNPFSGETTIWFKTPKFEEVELKIFTIDGKVLLSKKIYASMGLNEVILKSSELGNVGNGLLLYQLIADDYSKTRKMSLTGRR